MSACLINAEVDSGIVVAQPVNLTCGLKHTGFHVLSLESCEASCKVTTRMIELRDKSGEPTGRGWRVEQLTR